MTHGSKKKSQGNLEGNFNFVYFMNYNKICVTKFVDAAEAVPRRKGKALNACI